MANTYACYKKTVCCMGLLPDTLNCWLRMRRECRERLPRPPRVSDPDMHHGTCVTLVPWCMPGSLTSGFLWSRWRGKHSRRMRNPQFYVSGKRPMDDRWIPNGHGVLCYMTFNWIQRHNDICKTKSRYACDYNGIVILHYPKSDRNMLD